MKIGFVRNLFVFLTIVILAALLVACGGADEEPEEAAATEAPVEEEAAATEAPAEEEAVEPAAGDAASIAVEAAQQYSGTELTIMYEAGLQALDGYNFGPVWEDLTGIKINVVEVPFEEMYANPINEHLAGTGQFDIINIVPAWMGDFVAAGVVEPLDDFINQYYPEEELKDINPIYLDNWSQVGGVTYGLPDDGDVHLLYYRKDLFEDPENMSEFEDAFGYALAPPATWEEYNDICQFFTDKFAPETYGCAFQRKGQAYHWFFAAFRGNGGEFFDGDSMEALVNNEIGVETAEELKQSLEYGPPGQEEWGFIEVFSAFVSGDVAMAISWPPVGRWSQGFGVEEEALSWVPETTVAGNVGYATQPHGAELASGMALGVTTDSENKEAAYLFSQWLNSRDVSLQRVMSPVALRDPFRESHYESEEYKALWSNADEYLSVLREAQNNGFLDLSIPGSREYQEAVERAITAIYSGADIQATLDQLAADFDDITEEKGVDSQREAYADWVTR